MGRTRAAGVIAVSTLVGVATVFGCTTFTDTPQDGADGGGGGGTDAIAPDGSTTDAPPGLDGAPACTRLEGIQENFDSDLGALDQKVMSDGGVVRVTGGELIADVPFAASTTQAEARHTFAGVNDVGSVRIRFVLSNLHRSPNDSLVEVGCGLEIGASGGSTQVRVELRENLYLDDFAINNGTPVPTGAGPQIGTVSTTPTRVPVELVTDLDPLLPKVTTRATAMTTASKDSPLVGPPTRFTVRCGILQLQPKGDAGAGTRFSLAVDDVVVELCRR